MTITNATPTAMTTALTNAGTVQNFQGTTVWAGPPKKQKPQPTLQNWWRQKFGECSHALSLASPAVQAWYAGNAPGIHDWMAFNAARVREGRPVANDDTATTNNITFNFHQLWQAVGGQVQLTCNVFSPIPFYGEMWISVSTTDVDPVAPNDGPKKALFRGFFQIGTNLGDTGSITFSTPTPAHVGGFLYSRMYYYGYYVAGNKSHPNTATQYTIHGLT